MATLPLNWLVKTVGDGIPLSIEDLFAIAVWRRLVTDPLLDAVFKDGGRIIRKHVYGGDATGGKPRLVVGVILNREAFGLSRLIKGELRIGILCEFEAFQEVLRDMEPSVQSVLAYARTVVHSGAPHVEGRAVYELADPSTPGGILNVKPVSWEAVPGIPNDLKEPTAYALGMEAVIPYKAQASDRKVWTGGPIA